MLKQFFFQNTVDARKTVHVYEFINKQVVGIMNWNVYLAMNNIASTVAK